MPRDRDSYDVERVVLAHRPLARRLAARYARGNRDLLEELEQVAAVGLVQAARRFDPARGTAFSTFAVPTIVGELRRHFRDTRWALHVPRRLQEAFLAARQAEDEIAAMSGRPPSAAQVAERLGWPVEELLEARSAAGALTPVSLDAIGPDDDGATAPLVERFGTNDPGYSACELRDEVEQAIATLEPPADEALRLRVVEELTFDELAARIGVSPSHASKLVNAALARLRCTLRPQPIA
jgi:RNA polymerase sigma-B factor